MTPLGRYFDARMLAAVGMLAALLTSDWLYDFLHTAAPAREGLLHASTAAAMIF